MKGTFLWSVTRVFVNTSCAASAPGVHLTRPVSASEMQRRYATVQDTFVPANRLLNPQVDIARGLSFTDPAFVALHARRAITFNESWTRAIAAAAVTLAHTGWMRNRRRHSGHLSVSMNKTRR